MLYDRDANRKRLLNMDKIVENSKWNLLHNINSKLESAKYNPENLSTKPVVFTIKPQISKILKLNEDSQYVPRFSVTQKTHPLFAKFPVNKELKYSSELMTMAIQFGMLLKVQYRGAKDPFTIGHERIVLPMVLGTSAKGKPLLRVYHLRGWSVHKNNNINKEFRMFRTDRILSISFTGQFVRIAPAGYNALDKGMRGGIIKSADFEEIRRNQRSLLQKDVIQNKKEVTLDKVSNTIQVDDTNTILNLEKPFENPNIDEKNKQLLRLTFLKSTTSNEGIVVMGALGQRGNTIKIMRGGKYLGIWRVLKSTMGDALNRPHLKSIEGIKEFKLMIYIKKLA